MSDRCQVRFRVHSQDVALLATKLTGGGDMMAEASLNTTSASVRSDLFGGGATRDEIIAWFDGKGSFPYLEGVEQPGQYVDDEANYGHSTALQWMAKHRIRFYGDHAAGGDYPATHFYSSLMAGSPSLFQWATDGWDGDYGVKARDGVLDEESLAALRVFVREEKEMQDLVDASWASKMV